MWTKTLVVTKHLFWNSDELVAGLEVVVICADVGSMEGMFGHVKKAFEFWSGRS